MRCAIAGQYLAPTRPRAEPEAHAPAGVTCGPMQVLVLDGHGEATSSTAPLVAACLEAAGHPAAVVRLADAGFDAYMSADERAAYHETDNLVSTAQREAVALLRSSDALIVCCPIEHGTVPPRVKSWFERVLIPGVSFTFTRSGRITAALTNIRRVAMVVSCPDRSREPHRRASSGRSLLRGLRLNAHRLCRTSYVKLHPGDDAESIIAANISGW